LKRTLNEFKHENPVVKRIANALLDLGECWCYTADLMDDYGISQSAITRYGKRFEENRILKNGRHIWSGSSKTLQKIKEL